jgi:NAD(P)-dependent dehydrogenase (short-subunit alcohol dehydrogenase family)
MLPGYDSKVDIILVIGGSGGIGKAVVTELSSGEAEVISASVDPSADFTFDITDEESVTSLFSAVAARGNLRALVNAAGVVFFKELRETTLADWQRVLAINLTGTFLCCREAIKLFENSGGGRIVNLTSISNQHALPLNGAYAASKAGVKMITAILNEECGAKNIRATALHLGAVDTAVWDPYTQFDRANMLQAETAGRAIASILRQPLHVRIDEMTLAPGGGPL